MVRRPLSALLSIRPSLTRGRELARAAVDSTTDVLHPLFVIARGLRRQAGWARDWWGSTPKDRRGPALLASVGAGFLVLVLLPYGAYLMFAAWMGSAGWMGRDRTPAPSGPSGAENDRLTALYEALVPYLSVADDPSPLYAHDGSWENVFGDHAFEDGRLVRLHLKYPAYFTDGEAAARARVEHVLHAKVGRGREYRFEWNEEENHLTLTALPRCPRTSPPSASSPPRRDGARLHRPRVGAAHRPRPGRRGGQGRSPVVWRTGPRSTEPHLLALGHPGTGTTTLLRSIALQALPDGDVVVVDGSGTGEYAFLSGRPGVMAVESGLAGTLATLEWAAHETERRLIAVNRARQAGRTAPDDVRRPLWILVDRPTVLSQLAHAESRPDPQELLDIPLRHGRAAGVTVAVADHLDGAEALSQVVVAQTRARVLLGAVTAEQTQAVLGAPQCSTSAAQVPPGRGYVRLGTGPVLRVQVPATPDPFDEDAGDAHRQAVMALLPPADGAHGTEPREREAETADAPGAVMVSEPSGAVRPAGDPALER